GAAAQGGADHDEPRQRRRRRVVLGEELLRHLGLAALGRVHEVEAVAGGQDAVADLEDLGVGVGALDGDADQVRRLERLAGDPLALHQAPHRLQAVAQHRRPLELLRRRRLAHLALEVALHVAVAAGEEVDDRLDVAAILLAPHVADAGGLAALDVVVEAGRAGAAPRLGPLAGAELEQLAEQVQGLAHALRARVGAEVDAAGAVALAREVDARELLVEADADVGVGLVVPQADVEARPVAPDELLLGEQRLRLGLGDQEVHGRGRPGAVADRVRAPAEVGGDALADRGRLADLDHLPPGVLQQVHARLIGQALALLGQRRRHGPKLRGGLGARPGAGPHGHALATCPRALLGAGTADSTAGGAPAVSGPRWPAQSGRRAGPYRLGEGWPASRPSLREGACLEPERGFADEEVPGPQH